MHSTKYAYVNGRFIPESSATISIFDRGFLYGDGCFETMRVYEGKLFRFREHMERLFESLEALEIECPLTAEELRTIFSVLTERNQVANGFARLYVTAGASSQGPMTKSEHGVSLIAVTAERQFVHVKPKVIISSIRLDKTLSSHKTANRLPYMLARREAERMGADEAVMLNTAGRVVELTTSNLFVVKGGELFTPALSEGPLPGITRAVVLVLAAEMMLPVHEAMMGLPMLETAAEVFATNSLMEIVPVIRVKERAVPEEPITGRLQSAYREFVREELSL